MKNITTHAHSEKIVLDGSNEALAVMLAIEQMTRNYERRTCAEKNSANALMPGEDVTI